MVHAGKMVAMDITGAATGRDFNNMGKLPGIITAGREIIKIQLSRCRYIYRILYLSRSIHAGKYSL